MTTAPIHPGANGHYGFVLQVRNRGPQSCYLRGYPKLQQLDASGQVVQRPSSTPSGYLGGLPAGQSTPPTVRLAAGQTASALVEAFLSPDVAGCGDPSPALRMWLPRASGSRTLHISSAVCEGNEVHPFVAGSSGSV